MFLITVWASGKLLIDRGWALECGVECFQRGRISETLNEQWQERGVAKLTIHDARGAECSEDLREHVDGKLPPWEFSEDAGISVLARFAYILALGLYS